LTIPALPNHYPYNELLLSGKLSAKTRSWRWHHSGVTLLYTSTRTADGVCEAHGLLEASKTAPRGVLVGVGFLKPVRPNTERERQRIMREFFNGKRRTYGGWAGAYRYEFTRLRRFRRPIPFKPPRGVVQVFRVEYSHELARALLRVGVKPQDINWA
jgi:hypothetical protein